MAILHIDDFGVYDEVRGSGNMDLTWLSRAYEVRQSAVTGLRIKESAASDPYVRNVLANGQALTGNRSVYLPLGPYLFDNPSLTICQKLVDYTPNGTAIGGLSLVSPGQEDHILAFGFTGPRNGYVRYVGADGVVIEEGFLLPTSLSGQYDTIEWSFTKSSGDPSEYGPFTLWVNNRAAYAGIVFNQVGGSGVLAARILGGIPTLAQGQTSSTRFLNATGNVVVPAYGITDLAVTDGPRLGRVRVIGRTAYGDVGPNSMAPSEETEQHADLINKVPLSDNRYLSAVNVTAEERYWGLAFPDLSSENVLAVAVRTAIQKNSPDALDAVPVLSLGSNVYDELTLPTDLSPRFGQLILERNPWTNLNWTPLEANNTQFGVKVR